MAKVGATAICRDQLEAGSLAVHFDLVDRRQLKTDPTLKGIR